MGAGETWCRLRPGSRKKAVFRRAATGSLPTSPLGRRLAAPPGEASQVIAEVMALSGYHRLETHFAMFASSAQVNGTSTLLRAVSCIMLSTKSMKITGMNIC